MPAAHLSRSQSLRLLATLVAVAAPAVAAQGKPRVIENAELRYTVTVPSECRVEEGPGTFEAICAPDFDEATSVEMAAATALLLEVDAEPVPADAKAYGEAEFRQEVPEAVCGESDTAKVKLGDVTVTKDGAATILSAVVACPEIKFLGLAERRGQVRYVMQPGYRHRLMARSLVADGDRVKSAVDAFLASFKSTAETK